MRYRTTPYRIVRCVNSPIVLNFLLLSESPIVLKQRLRGKRFFSHVILSYGVQIIPHVAVWHTWLVPDYTAAISYRLGFPALSRFGSIYSRCRSVFLKKDCYCIPPKSKQKCRILVVSNSSLFKKRFDTASTRLKLIMRYGPMTGNRLFLSHEAWGHWSSLYMFGHSVSQEARLSPRVESCAKVYHFASAHWTKNLYEWYQMKQQFLLLFFNFP